MLGRRVEALFELFSVYVVVGLGRGDLFLPSWVVGTGVLMVSGGRKLGGEIILPWRRGRPGNDVDGWVQGPR